MSQIEYTKAELAQYPDGTRKFMFFIFPVACGITALAIGTLISNITGIGWIMWVMCGVGLAIGAVLGYVICIKPLREENKENDAVVSEQLTEHDKKDKIKRTFTYNLAMVWGISLAVAMFCGVAFGMAGGTVTIVNGEQDIPFNWKHLVAFGCLIYFVGSIVLGFIFSVIAGKTPGKYTAVKFKNTVTVYGTVNSCSLIGGGGDAIAWRVTVAVHFPYPLVSYVKAGLEPPYQKGQKVCVQYEENKTKKCKIIEELQTEKG